VSERAKKACAIASFGGAPRSWPAGQCRERRDLVVGAPNVITLRQRRSAAAASDPSATPDKKPVGARGGPPQKSVLKPYYESSRFLVRHVPWITCVFCLFYGFAFAFLAPFVLLFFAIPLAVLVGLVIWALPELPRPPVKTLEHLFFAFALSLALWPNYLALALPGLPWITLQRLTSYPMAAVFLVCISVSRDFRRTIASIANATPILSRALIFFTALQVLSVAFSTSVFQSVNQLLVALVNWTLVYFISVYIFARPGRIRLWAIGAWMLSIYVGLIALVEFRNRHVPWAGHIPSFLKIESDLVERILAGSERTGTSKYRAQSVFTTPLALAEFIALSMPFIVHFGVRSTRSWVRISAWASVVLLVTVVVFTGSRLGMAGVFLSFLLYPLFWAALKRKEAPGHVLSLIILAGYPALFSVLLAASLFVHRISGRVWGNDTQSQSTGARIVQWTMGLPKIAAHPWGYGIGRAGETLGYRIPSGMLTIDSYYLSLVLDYGILGFVLYFSIFFSAMYYAGKFSFAGTRAGQDESFVVPAFIALANFITIKAVFSQPDNHAIVFMILGMISAVVFRLKFESAEKSQVANQPINLHARGDHLPAVGRFARR
jgi:hypothetical protein